MRVTYVLFQVCDVFAVFCQGLEDLQPVREVLITWLVVSYHLEEVGSQRAESFTLHKHKHKEYVME